MMAADGIGEGGRARAVLAAACFAVDPARLGGVVVRSWPGPQRDRWLTLVRDMLPQSAPLRRIPHTIATGRLLGGLDLAATVARKQVVADRGCLVEADGGVVVLTMAERVPLDTAAQIGTALEAGEVMLERDGLTLRTPTRFGLIALDEGDGPDERVPATLADRLAVWLDFTGLRELPDDPGFTSGDIARARERLDDVVLGEDAVQAVCETAAALGIPSLRAPVLALQVARIAAALDGCEVVSQDHIATACQLVLAPRATRLPATEPDEERLQEPTSGDHEPPENETEQLQSTGNALADVVLEAAKAAIPMDLLQRLQSAGMAPRGAAATGRAGGMQSSGVRGRPLSARRGRPGRGQRLDLVATLRAAAPWQRHRKELRQGAGFGLVEVRLDDFHVIRRKHRTATTAIFAIDASGSSALHRLAEAKGAVELLLADCYVRRDEVAVLAFRGRAAELLLAPTRSLVRAKRSLAGLPGGGGTPLAAAIEAACTVAEAARRKGRSPAVVLLTDGRGNVARDGTQGRERGDEDARAAARRLRTEGYSVMLIDTSPRPQEQARRLAAEMNATYLALPHADASVLSRAVRGALIPDARVRD